MHAVAGWWTFNNRLLSKNCYMVLRDSCGVNTPIAAARRPPVCQHWVATGLELSGIAPRLAGAGKGPPVTHGTSLGNNQSTIRAVLYFTTSDLQIFPAYSEFWESPRWLSKLQDLLETDSFWFSALQHCPRLRTVWTLLALTLGRWHLRCSEPKMCFSSNFGWWEQPFQL